MIFIVCLCMRWCQIVGYVDIKGAKFEKQLQNLPRGLEEGTGHV